MNSQISLVSWLLCVISLECRSSQYRHYENTSVKNTFMTPPTHPPLMFLREFSPVALKTYCQEFSPMAPKGLRGFAPRPVINRWWLSGKRSRKPDTVPHGQRQYIWFLLQWVGNGRLSLVIRILQPDRSNLLLHILPGSK